MSTVAAGEIKNRGPVVTAAGLGINLMLGVLYSWAVFKSAMQTDWGWSVDKAGIPYALCCLVFAFAMIPAGKLQDKLSPRLVATIGGVLVGLGMALCAIAGNSFPAVVIGFGVLVGAGIGFGYASATPPAVKWFPSRRTGLIAGLVVSGFGLASLFIVPLATMSLSGAGISNTFLYFGIVFFVIVILLAQILKSPPAGYVPVDNAPQVKTKKVVVHGEEMTWKQMIKTPQFYLLWLMFFCGSGVGLMVIGQAKTIVGNAASTLGLLWLGTACLMLLAVGNGAGRIIAGFLSDRIGRTLTMFSVFLVQAIMLGVMMILAGAPSAALFIASFILMGFNYGACLSVFPSAAKDYFGLKNFGLNYGIVFTAWGVGGFVLTRVAGLVKDATGSYVGAFLTGIGALVIAMILTFVTKPPHQGKGIESIGSESRDEERELVGTAK